MSEIHLLGQRQGLSVPEVLVQIEVCNVSRQQIKVSHCFLEGLSPGIVVRDLSECFQAEKRRDMVNNSARNHRGCEKAAVGVRGVKFLAKTDQFCKVEPELIGDCGVR